LKVVDYFNNYFPVFSLMTQEYHICGIVSVIMQQIHTESSNLVG